MKKVIPLILAFLLVSLSVHAQNGGETFSLKQAYEAFFQNYPTVSKKALFEEIRSFNRKMNKSLRYPDVNLNGSASYQSDVTEVPFAAPGSDPPTFSKDHYSISVDINQSVYDGGRVKVLNEIEESKLKVNQSQLEVELHQLRAELDQVFFGILLLQKQKRVQESFSEELKEQLNAVSSGVKNGVLLPGNEWTLEAEGLKIRQQIIQTGQSISAGYMVLEQFTAVDLSHRPTLVSEFSDYRSTEDYQVIERPEFDFFSASKEVLMDQKELVGSEGVPVVSAFAKSAYSRPGLNAFSDDLEFWWMIGIKAKWNLRSWRNSSRKQEILSIRQKNIDADRDAFTLQLNASLVETESRIEALKAQIELDREVLELRRKVVAEKKSLLDEGMITSTEWLTEMQAQQRAQLDLEIHQVELVKAQAELRTKRGISWN